MHVVVDYEELNRMSAVWGAAASSMARLAMSVASVAADPELAADAVFDPAGAARAVASIIDCVAGPGGLAAIAAELAVDAVLLKAVVAKEEIVDDMPIHQLLGVQRWLSLLPLTFAVDPAAAVRDGEHRIGALADALPGYLAPFSDVLVEALAPSAAFRLEVAQRRPLTVDPVLGLPVGAVIAATDERPGVALASTYQPSWASDAAPTMAVMLRRVGDLEAQPAASMAIQRVVGTDGVARYVVLLPGMRHLGYSADPQDLPGAVSAVVGGSTTYTRCVTEALDAAGVPPGAQVVLVGHSQGGIVAMDLAGDPAFNGGRVHVAQVIAAGSPIGAKAVAAGSGTRVFEIDNVNDIVPHLGGAESSTVRQGVGRLTYQFSSDGHDIVATHDVDNYADQLQALHDSPNPLLATVAADLGPFMTGSTTTSVFTLRDGAG